jgi:hypothetical protein
MNHPFTLDISDLEAIELNIEDITDEEATQVQGGLSIATTKAVGEEGGDVTTLALGEEGGDGDIVCISAPCPGSESGDDSWPKKRRIKRPICEPKFTTLALGEEGGDFETA